MTPGSNGKKVKRIKENRILTIKKLWENADRNKERKRLENKIEVETDVKKIISGIEVDRIRKELYLWIESPSRKS